MSNEKSMPKLLQLAATYNNQGVTFLNRGLTRHAISCFNKGLQTCRPLVKGFEQKSGLSHRLLGSRSVTLDAILQAAGSERASKHPSEEQTPAKHYIHEQPIVLPSNILQHRLLDTVTILPAILLFNQALTHHLEGMKNSKNHIRWFKVSLKLYEVAFSHIVQEDLWDSSICYLVACLNNMGSIHYRLRQTESGKKCFQQLMSMLKFLVDSEEPETAMKLLHINLVGIVSHPLAVLLPKEATLGPAADARESTGLAG
jgi:hypothetical protein